MTRPVHVMLSRFIKAIHYNISGPQNLLLSLLLVLAVLGDSLRTAKKSNLSYKTENTVNKYRNPLVPMNTHIAEDIRS